MSMSMSMTTPSSSTVLDTESQWNTWEFTPCHTLVGSMPPPDPPPPPEPPLGEGGSGSNSRYGGISGGGVGGLGLDGFLWIPSCGFPAQVAPTAAAAAVASLAAAARKSAGGTLAVNVTKVPETPNHCNEFAGKGGIVRRRS